MNTGKSLAELAAMRAKGQLTDQEFDEARRLIEKQEDAAAKASAKEKKPGCRRVFVAFLIAVGIIGLLTVFSEKPTGTSHSTQKAVAPSQEDAEKKRKGFHCLSSWDGSHREFVQELTKTLRDPDSFEHAETRITPISPQGEHTVIMKYRAKNGFGGTNIGVAMATIRSADCDIVRWEPVSD